MKKWLKNLILFLIQLIEKYEYRNLDLDEDDITKKIIDTIDISNDNIQVLSHDGYHPITHIHKTQPYTVYELELESGDKLECADNHIVFCEGFEQKFVKDLTNDDFVMTKFGLSRVKSIYKSKYKVSMYDVTVDSEDHSYYGNNILNHNTVIAAIFILHNTIFNYDNNVGIAANKFATAVEIMDKIKEMMSYLPFFMQPGVIVNNQAQMSFSNGCRILAQATTAKSFIGYTIHTLYLDEFAHVDQHILNTFYENIMPTVSSMEDSKIIITSTPNGYNKFFDIYDDAVNGRNSYHPIKVDWWQVPGRDEKWRDKMINDCGGEDEFMRQYGNSFLSTGNTLLSPESLAKIQKTRVKYEFKEIPELDKFWEYQFSNLVFRPDYDIRELKNSKEKIVMSIDLSEGGGNDNSVLNFFHLKTKDISDIRKYMNDVDNETKKSDFFRLVQFAKFADNNTPLETLARLVYILVMKVIGPDNIRIVMESNAFGGEFIRLLQSVFDEKNEFDTSTILKFKHSNDSNVRKFGVKVKADNKAVLCVSLKYHIASNNIIITDTDTVSEFEVFCKVGNSWKASRGHDDIAMSTVDLCAIYDHPYFDVMMEDTLDIADDDSVQKLYESNADNRFSGGIYSNGNNIQNVPKLHDYGNSDTSFNGYFGKSGLYK